MLQRDPGFPGDPLGLIMGILRAQGPKGPEEPLLGLGQKSLLALPLDPTDLKFQQMSSKS